MLNPEAVTTAVVTPLRTIAALVAAMGADSSRIAGHYFLFGDENRLVKAIYGMKPPSVLVVYEAQLGGNFDGQSIFKHRLGVYIRSGNMANQGSPTGLWNLWALIMNGAVNSGTHNIRVIDLIAGQLAFQDNLPSASLLQDEDGNDYLKGLITLSEIGDN